MENRFILKFKWTKKRSTNESINGNPVCTLYVNEIEKISIMSPGNEDNDLKFMKCAAFVMWAKALFPDIVNTNNLTSTIDNRYISDLDYQWAIISEMVKGAGFLLTKLTTEPNLEIYLIEKE